ncbi:hypothetical protein ACQ4M3_23330 [Leptolyngbya sp. AN03gr2]|uniref:hypothetical protein n=1 Tax=unclassified Leptolyngbya TaxID=2650499 RepID=UPI003D31A41A
MSQRFVHLITLLIFGLSLLQSVRAQSPTLAGLANGDYQICNQSPPKDRKQGAGGCLVFHKQNDQIEGYYGYPHSDAFVCLRGTLKGTQIVGQGYLVSWQGSQWRIPSRTAFFWDQEHQLQLAQGKVIQNQPN